MATSLAGGRSCRARLLLSLPSVESLAWAVSLGLVVDPRTGSGPAAEAGGATAGAVATPTASEPAALLAVLAETDRDLAVAQARRLAALVAVVGLQADASSTVERQKAHEVGIALAVSTLSAETQIARARSLSGPWACFGAALSRGAVSYPHCLAALEVTVHVTDEHDPRPDRRAGVAGRDLLDRRRAAGRGRGLGRRARP